MFLCYNAIDFNSYFDFQTKSEAFFAEHPSVVSFHLSLLPPHCTWLDQMKNILHLHVDSWPSVLRTQVNPWTQITDF